MAPGTGVNRDLPAPTIAPISTSTVTGAATGPAGATIFIELFANASCAVAANGEGATFLQFVSATISAGGGPATWSATIGGLVDGQGLTATSTNSTTSDTSAFSACTQVATPKAGLGLTADEASVPAGAANVPLASVPAGVLGQFAFAPVPNSPVPNSAVGAAPVPNSPVPNSPVPNSPVPNSPVPNSPVPNSGFDGIAATDLAKILLSSIPIDWSTIFVGTDPHAGVPVTRRRSRASTS
jgi:hypothetical protein